MKNLDIITTVLLIVGGLNWGLFGLWNTDLVASIFGVASSASKIVYTLVGLSAIYQIVQLKCLCAGTENKTTTGCCGR